MIIKRTVLSNKRQQYIELKEYNLLEILIYATVFTTVLQTEIPLKLIIHEETKERNDGLHGGVPHGCTEGALGWLCLSPGAHRKGRFPKGVHLRSPIGIKRVFKECFLQCAKNCVQAGAVNQGGKHEHGWARVPLLGCTAEQFQLEEKACTA